MVGLVEACTNSPPLDDGSGGSSSGGSSSGGSSSGGSSSGGSSSGGSSSGGKVGSGGTTSTGGSSSGGMTASTGGSTGSGGTITSSGGSSSTGGASGGGMNGGGGRSASSSGGAGGSTGMPGNPMFKENTGDGCTLSGTVPTFADAKTNAKLPDPFKLLSGMRISKKEDWTCMRNELKALLEASIYGPKMPPPDKLTASYSGGKMTVNMMVGSQMGSFSVTISGGGTKDKPVPVLITCGGSSLPKMSGVAQIDMQNNSMDMESKTVASGGLVHTLYGDKAKKSGSLIGWAWGCSRIIDGLIQCPEAGIDVKRIAVTGCSRNGKGALAMGAFDERVALTLMQEGGSGGSALWRVSTAEKMMGQNIQEATEIVGEANWQGSDFKQYASMVTKLPADQHFTVALCAPRAVLLIENDIDWLGPVASYGGGIAGRAVFEALGIKDRCGVSVAANHGHCSFPSAQQKYLDAFVTRFLKGGTADTTADDFHVSASTSKLQKFDPAMWIDWTTPTLSGNLPFDPFA